MNHYTDAMIATSGAMSDAQFDEVASKFQLIDGIAQFTRSRYVPRVICVSYNTGKVRALSLLNQFASLGFKASLVDM